MSEDDDGGESAGAEALIQMRPTTRGSTIWAITAVMVVLASSFAHGEERRLVEATDWPGWRGPERDGTALGFAVPEVWPEELQRRWRVRVGSGYSAPVVAGSRVFVQSREEGHEVVRALELASGKVLWNQRYAVPFNPRMGSGRHGPGPKASPAHDGERLFTTSITGVLSAWAADSGELLWREDFADRFNAWARVPEDRLAAMDAAAEVHVEDDHPPTMPQYLYLLAIVVGVTWVSTAIAPPIAAW